MQNRRLFISEISNIRKAKVYERSQVREHGYKYVPNISLQGDWLKQYSFDTGTLISVQCEDGKLTIIPREPDLPDSKVQNFMDQLENLSAKDIRILEQSLELHKKNKKSKKK